MPLWLEATLLALGAVLLLAAWRSWRRRSRWVLEMRRVIETAGYELVHGANAARAHLMALEQQELPAACAPHLGEIGRALERIERGASRLAEALRRE